ncbi:MAG: 3-methyl-2-oxobutanoate hydroxymethyltransferase [Candidatus Cloacimonetes bacterium]|nr:3-methyl-2-oxobutanoate hydroxymethyltransferase [Candidatus Cloacimonadota bacterium]
MKNLKEFKKMKEAGDKIAMITAYDYPSGKYVEASGADVILVGDSLGMVIQGYENTLKVTLEDMVYHSRAVRRGAPNTFIIADLPFLSYHINLAETKRNAARLYRDGGINAVKLEGGKASRVDAIKAIVDCEIPVCAHLGLTPQSIGALGGYIVQGKEEKDYQRILQQAMEIEDAGAFMLVLEGIPEPLGEEITRKACIPTIGIGAGRYTDGQVLVFHDLLGMSDIKPKFVKQYANLGQDIPASLSQWKDQVKNKEFPERRNVYNPMD